MAVPPSIVLLGVVLPALAEPVPELPMHAQSCSTAQVKPAPQSVSVLQGSVYLGTQELVVVLVHVGVVVQVAPAGHADTEHSLTVCL